MSASQIGAQRDYTPSRVRAKKLLGRKEGKISFLFGAAFLTGRRQYGYT